ncbi:hypothetical protein WMY93_025267 [Mugilogobius chulae]|uniref:Uncharacterized protein n=1 Tax=Mugilogobius chulae TaxID=88201 RepID=A0AAW0NCZ7_9GOBI
MGYYFHPSRARLPHGDWDQIVFGLRVSGNLLEEDLPALSFDEDDAGELEVGAALTPLHRRYDFVPSEEESGYNSVPEEEEPQEEDIPRFQEDPLRWQEARPAPAVEPEGRAPTPSPQQRADSPSLYLRAMLEDPWSGLPAIPVLSRRPADPAPMGPTLDFIPLSSRRKRRRDEEEDEEEDEPSSKRRCFSSSEDSSEDSSDDSGPSTSAETSGGFRRYFHCPHLFQDEDL